MSRVGRIAVSKVVGKAIRASDDANQLAVGCRFR